MENLIPILLVVFTGCGNNRVQMANEQAEIHRHTNQISKFIDSISKKIQIEEVQLDPPKGAIFTNSDVNIDTTGNYAKLQELEERFNKQMDSVKIVLGRLQKRYLFLDRELKKG